MGANLDFVKCCSPANPDKGQDTDHPDQNPLHMLAKKAYMANLKTEDSSSVNMPYDEFDSDSDSHECERHLQVPAAVISSTRHAIDLNRNRSHSMTALCNNSSRVYKSTKKSDCGKKPRFSRRQRPRSNSVENHPSSKRNVHCNASMVSQQQFGDFDRPSLNMAYLDHSCNSAASSPLSTLSHCHAHIILTYSDSSFPFDLQNVSNSPLQENEEHEHEHGHDEYEAENEDEDYSDCVQKHDGEDTKRKTHFPMRVFAHSCASNASNPILLSM